MIPIYKAVALKTGKIVKGWPAESMSGRTYLITMIDDYNADFERIGYVQVHPDTLERVEK